MNRIDRTTPDAPVSAPDCAQTFVVVAYKVNGEPVVVETTTGRCHRKWMFSAEISVEQLLLFLDRAKRRGRQRVKMQILADVEDPLRPGAEPGVQFGE